MRLSAGLTGKILSHKEGLVCALVQGFTVYFWEGLESKYFQIVGHLVVVILLSPPASHKQLASKGLWPCSITELDLQKQVVARCGPWACSRMITSSLIYKPVIVMHHP